MGAVGIIASVVWLATIHSPNAHPGISAAELEYISKGGALVDMDPVRTVSARALDGEAARQGPRWSYIRQLLANRMLLGVYVGQYCITTLTYFFLTWFPVYLVRQRGMSILNAGFVAALPAICGFVGGVLGGLFSDYLLRRGFSLTVARKTPIVAGMLLSTSMIACNHVEASIVVVAVMSLAFFGKGVGALGWAVVSDTSPKEISGLSGALFNTFGNTAAVTTPIVIGYLISQTGSFNAALVFVAASALGAVCSYLFVVGEIRRLELVKA
jgi:ACS family glucarate transporter-like MFS transporter